MPVCAFETTKHHMLMFQHMFSTVLVCVAWKCNAMESQAYTAMYTCCKLVVSRCRCAQHSPQVSVCLESQQHPHPLGHHSLQSSPEHHHQCQIPAGTRPTSPRHHACVHTAKCCHQAVLCKHVSGPKMPPMACRQALCLPMSLSCMTVSSETFTTCVLQTQHRGHNNRTVSRENVAICRKWHNSRP